MPKKIISKIKNGIRAAKGKRGSGIITTLVALVFLVSAGSSILMVAYTGYQMNVTQLAGNQAQARAETGKNMILVAMQNVTSELEQMAYNNALPYYGNSQTDIEGVFKSEFLKVLKNVKTGTLFGSKPLFITSGDKIVGYDVSVLQDIIEEQLRTPKSDKIEYDLDHIKILSKDSSVTQTSSGIIMHNIMIRTKEGRSFANATTAVIGDLKLSYPKFNDEFYQYVAPEVAEYVAVVKDKIVSINNEVNTVKSSFYCKRLSVDGSGIFTLTGNSTSKSSYFIKRGIEIGGKVADGQYKFVSEDSTNLWVGGIKVHLESSAWLKGDEKVADDLDLFGTGAKVKIGQKVEGSNIKKGEYIGFGYDNKDMNKSSSVTANTRGVKLDIGDASKFVLNGVAFVADSSNKIELLDGTIDDISPYNFSGAYIDAHKDFEWIDSDGIRRRDYNLGSDFTLDSDLINRGLISKDPSGQSTGYSVAGKDIQRMILVPAEHLQYQYNGEDGKPTGKVFYDMESNPMKFDTPDGFAGITVSLNADSVLWYDDKGDSKKYADYGVYSVTTLGSKYGEESTAIYLLNFGVDNKEDDIEKSNEYFQDYLKYNTKEVNNYIQKYITMEGNFDFSNVSTAGNMYVSYNENGITKYQSIEPMSKTKRNILKAEAVKLQNDFDIYTTYLNTTIKSAATLSKDSNEPYSLIINKGNISLLGDQTDTERVKYKDYGTSGKIAEVYDENGNLICVIAHGDYEINAATPESLALVVCDAKVTVKNKENFKGLIFSENLCFEKKVAVESAPQGVIDAVKVLKSEGIYDTYFKVPLYSEEFLNTIGYESVGTNSVEWINLSFD